MLLIPAIKNALIKSHLTILVFYTIKDCTHAIASYYESRCPPQLPKPESAAPTREISHFFRGDRKARKRPKIVTFPAWQIAIGGGHPFKRRHAAISKVIVARFSHRHRSAMTFIAFE